MEATNIQLWIAFGLLGLASAGFFALLRRSIGHLDETIDGHDKDITDLKVQLARADKGIEAMQEDIRQIRHDQRDTKAVLNTLLQNSMEVVRLLGGRK